MKRGFVEKKSVDMEKVNAFVNALAGVEARCKEMSNNLVDLNYEKNNMTEKYSILLEEKFKQLKVNFSLAKSEGKHALKSIKKAVVDVE